jgi:hypothetical protein
MELTRHTDLRLTMNVHTDQGIFNTDANGSIPELVNSLLVFSRPGRLDLLPALPQALPRGSLSGILARGQIQVDRLQWNAPEGALHLELTSGKEQTLTLRLPTKDRIRSMAVARGPAAVRESPRGPNSREVDLPKGRPVALDLRF